MCDGEGFWEGEEGSCCCSVTPDLLPVRNGLEFAEGAVAVKVPQPRLWGTGLGGAGSRLRWYGMFGQ